MKVGKNAVNFLLLTAALFGVLGCNRLKSEPKVEINHKIVSKWSGKTFDGMNSVVFEFTRDGKMNYFMNGKETVNETYRLKDEKTVELETKKGTKYEITVEFSDNDQTMTMIDFTRIRTKLKRE